MSPTLNRITEVGGSTVESRWKKNSEAKMEVDVDADPDKIGCPICSKQWHRSNLRNHLFYGHHMKTSEVQEVS